VHEAKFVLPAGDDLLDGHVVHDPDPVESLNVPDGQIVHAAPWGPVEPALQMQEVEAVVLPAGESEFADTLYTCQLCSRSIFNGGGCRTNLHHIRDYVVTDWSIAQGSRTGIIS